MTNPELPPDAIRRELISILHNSELKNSVVLSNFLEFVVTEKLAANGGQIKEYTIGIQALGRPIDFNPQMDATVRIHAGRLRKVLNNYYSHQGKENEIVISIPKGTYVPVFESRKNIIKEDDSITNGVNRDKIFFKPQPGWNLYKMPVLAVLPFHNLSSENAQDFFVKGIGERLNTELAKFQTIKVVSYYTTNKYDKGIDLKELQNENVDYVLTGSIRIIDRVLRLSLQLLLTDIGEIIWAEHFQRPMTEDNSLEIEEHILKKVLNTLADENGIIMRNRLKAVIHEGKQLSEIEQAVYRYYDFSNEFEPAKFESTLWALRNANRTFPDFPLVSALLSGLYLNIFAVTPEHNGNLLNDALQLAKAALKYDGYCQEGRKALAWAYLYAGNKERSREEIEKCIQINPKAATTISTMALAYVCLGEYKKGLRLLQETSNLSDSLPICSQLGYAIYYYSTGNYKKSLLFLNRVNTLEFPFYILLQYSVEGHMGIKSVLPEDSLQNLTNHSDLLIDRFLFDQTLKKDVFKGLQLSAKLTGEATTSS